MVRMSARFIGRDMGIRASDVYAIWHDMGLVIKDRFGGWILTEAGKKIGGEMSMGGYIPVPTFDFTVIKQLMDDFCNKVQ